MKFSNKNANQCLWKWMWSRFLWWENKKSIWLKIANNNNYYLIWIMNFIHDIYIYLFDPSKTFFIIINFMGKRKLKIKLAFIKFMNDEFKLFYWFFHQSLKIFFCSFSVCFYTLFNKNKNNDDDEGPISMIMIMIMMIKRNQKKRKRNRKKENFLFFFIFEKYKKEINFLILWSSCGAEQLLGNEFSFFTVLLFCFLFFLEFQKNGSIRWC